MADRRPTRHRAFCITINNWTQEDYSLALLSPYTYIIIGRERGEENNLPHLQIYLEVVNPISIATLAKKYFPRAHIEPRYGTQKQAREYCCKEHYHEYGLLTQQGKRTDLLTAKHLLENNISIREALESEMITSLSTLTAYEKLSKYYVVHRTRPRVFWIYGPGGSGKTDKAYSLAGPDVFKLDLIKEGWIDGYDRHKAIIIDDLDITSDDKKLFGTLLSLLDKNPLKMNVKGSSASIAAEIIIITSQKAPWHIWYSSEDMSLVHSHSPTRQQIERDIDLRQIMRRITEVIRLTGNKELNYPKITTEGD
jgi:hypothetical protein